MTTRSVLNASRAVVFDLDGTLVDTLPDLTSALNQALSDEGLDAVSPALVRASLHGGLQATALQALAHLQADTSRLPMLTRRYCDHYERNAVVRSKPYEGVLALLSSLREHHFPIAVCTNKPKGLAIAVLDGLRLRDFFSVVVGADSCLRPKPDPMPLHFALHQLQACAADAVMVGDSMVDLQCARAAGVTCLFFAGGYGAVPPQFFPRPGEFQHYDELL